MRNLIAVAKQFAAAEDGASMVEYGIMVALVAAVSITLVTTLGKYVGGSFKTVNDSLAASPVTPLP